jgi:hypothetical protein
MDSVGQWYFGQKNRTSRRFSSGLRSLARHVDRKMTIVVPVVPFTNRVNNGTRTPFRAWHFLHPLYYKGARKKRDNEQRKSMETHS